MIAFLRWLRDVALGTLTGLAKFAFLLVLIVVALFAVALVEGDGLPQRMVLNLDLRNVPPDSSHAAHAADDGHGAGARPRRARQPREGRVPAARWRPAGRTGRRDFRGACPLS